MNVNNSLRSDIVNNHTDRMGYLKKYLPFFRLQEVSLSQFKEGKYAIVDMGYITMAVLRFFIEENHFKDQTMTYPKIAFFITELLTRDFELLLEDTEAKELVDYIFDKMKNEGKPFEMEYFDPEDKKRKILRMRLIESKLVKGTVEYSITADAIEFYLETKEVKEESKINIQQLLLEKMIATKNFRGGIDVVKRINSEVTRLRLKKQEVLLLLGINVFEGVKALEEFQKTGIHWFSEEQKAFEKNKELIETALLKAETMNKEQVAHKEPSQDREYADTLKEIYELEIELKKAMTLHSRLLADCMDLQVKADEIISKYKYSRLRNAFDFTSFLEKAKGHNNSSTLTYLVQPFLLPFLNKSFYIRNINDVLTYQGNKEESGEAVVALEEHSYEFDDVLEEQRISKNYAAILKVMMNMFVTRDEFTLEEFNKELLLTFFDEIFQNSDYYSFLVHLCQKKSYDLNGVIKHQDTFFDAILADFLRNSGNERYDSLSFHLELCSDYSYEDKEVELERISHIITLPEKDTEFVTSNFKFVRDY